jgi:hypothetical protein
MTHQNASNIEVMVELKQKGGKAVPMVLLGFSLDRWGSGGRRFKSDHPDFEAKNRWVAENV